jgi:hypothetical protein
MGFPFPTAKKANFDEKSRIFVENRRKGLAKSQVKAKISWLLRRQWGR